MNILKICGQFSKARTSFKIREKILKRITISKKMEAQTFCEYVDKILISWTLFEKCDFYKKNKNTVLKFHINIWKFINLKILNTLQKEKIKG